MISKMKRIYRFVREWYKGVLMSKSDYKVSLFTKLKYAFRGFTVNEYIWYDLKNNNYKEYISDFERVRSREINGDYKIILDNKILFEEIFRNYVKVPRNYAWYNNGNIYGLHEFAVNKNNIIDFIKEKKAVVIKWENGYEGKGVFVIKFDNEIFTINNKKSSEKDVKKLFESKDSAIICEYITQNDFENSLYPNSNNTIRIVCAKKKGEEKAKIIKAVQRIGTDYCKPVDNVSAGGLAAEINISTGKLGKAIAKFGEMEKRMVPYSSHPDTNAIIEGKTIPNWTKIKEKILEVTNNFPYFNFIAWDISLTEEGICIIEGNASSGCGMFQLTHGIKNEEFGEIYKSYGITK